MIGELILEKNTDFLLMNVTTKLNFTFQKKKICEANGKIKTFWWIVKVY